MEQNKMLSVLIDRERPMEERRFVVLTTSAAIAYLVNAIVGFVIGENVVECITYGILSLVAVIVLHLALKLMGGGIGGVIMTFVILAAQLPMTFVYGGGTEGGLVPWLGVAFLYIGMSTKSVWRYAALLVLVFESLVFFRGEFFNLIRIKKHTGDLVYLDAYTSTVIVGLYIFTVCVLITHITQKESEYSKEQTERVEELNQMQNRFFSSMSHEIRTPINTIIGLNEMILREDISDEVAEDAVSIQAASKMLLTTVNDILDMSKIESGDMEIVPVVYSIGDVLSDVVGMIWHTAKDKGLDFNVDTDESLPRAFYGDEVRIKQILINVLNNAVKYTEKGLVVLTVRWEKVDDNNANLIFTITDTGIGIKKESIPYLFTAFKRVDEDKNRYIEGTGLGLSIVKKFVDLMGGQISVNSIYTKGSVFVIKIPQVISDKRQVGDLMIESKHSLSARKDYKQTFEAPDAKVLIVDDNASNLMVATKLLRDTKVQIDTADSGEEALSCTVHTKYDVIFMDHLMPEMDGIECLHAIQGQVGGYNKNTPIVALTANAGSDLKALYMREGFEGYVLKPVTGETLEGELLKYLPKELIHIVDASNVEDGAKIGRTELAKKTIIISTDSVCDLAPDTLAYYDIPTLPYHIHIKGAEFLDGIEAEADGVVTYIAEHDDRVTTDSPSVEEYESFFAEQLSRAHSVVHITMAKNASKGYERALEAATTFDSVHVVDSGHLSGGLGFVVLHAVERAKEGASAEAIVEELADITKRVRTSCFLESTEYMCKSGWISKNMNRIAKTLSLHPVMVLKKSHMKLGGFRVGGRDTSLERYVNSMIDRFAHIDKRLLIIEYVAVDDKDIEMVKEFVAKRIKFERVVVQKASSTVAANCGAGAIGLMYMMEK